MDYLSQNNDQFIEQIKSIIDAVWNHFDNEQSDQNFSIDCIKCYFVSLTSGNNFFLEQVVFGYTPTSTIDTSQPSVSKVIEEISESNIAYLIQYHYGSIVERPLEKILFFSKESESVHMINEIITDISKTTIGDVIELNMSYPNDLSDNITDADSKKLHKTQQMIAEVLMLKYDQTHPKIRISNFQWKPNNICNILISIEVNGMFTKELGVSMKLPNSLFDNSLMNIIPKFDKFFRDYRDVFLLLDCGVPISEIACLLDTPIE